MEEKTVHKKREWVKNAAIIFLVVMLLLTFFSNTIMNYSLPEVSAQYVTSGTLSEQIRGTVSVAAAENYEMKLDETRVISSVHFKAGDTINKDDVILTLEDKDSTELQTAQNELDTLKFDYEKLLINRGFDYSISNLEISNLEEDIRNAKAELPNILIYQQDYEKAQANTIAANEKVNEITRLKTAATEQMSALSSENYIGLEKQYYDRIQSAQDAVTNAEKNKTTADSNVEQIQKQVTENTVDRTALAEKKKAITDAEAILSNYRNVYDEAMLKGEATSKMLLDIQNASDDVSYATQAYNDMLNKSLDGTIYSTRLKNAQSSQTNAANEVTNAKNKLDKIKLEISLELKKISDGYSTQLDNANAALETAKSDEEKAKAKASTTIDAAEEEILKQERELSSKKTALAKQQNDDMKTQGAADIDLQAKQDAITKKTEEVEKLRAKKSDVSVKAQVGGVIESITCVAGETLQPNTTFATIQMTEKGNVAQLSVTLEQAKKVTVGDEVTVEHFWNGEANVNLTGIKADPSNARNKLLVFSVTGDVTPGTQLEVVMGSKGRFYDMIVPSNAIREDSNGKFVLTVVAKSTPLGNRYITNRVSVTVQAANDKMTAVTGELMPSDFIITTSTKPLEAGSQVRLIENG